MWGRSLRWVAAAGAAIVLAGACGSDEAESLRRAKMAEGCLINTDCQSPLVCAFRACHVQCKEQRDCPEGELCVPTDKPFNVCMFEDEQECQYNSECPDKFKCVAAKCRPECKTEWDCVPDQMCVSSSCAVPQDVSDGGLIYPDGSPDASVGQPCLYHSDCSGTLICLGGSCLPQCKSDKDCPLGWSCNPAQACVQPIFDAGTDVASDGGPGSCANGVQDPGETGLDCGGTCGACASAACTKPSDCASHVCTAQKCAAPTCTDGLQNGSESDVDCGGPSCSKCPSAKGCWTTNDCAEGSCIAGVCTSPGCTDGIKSGNETDVDCGGPTCGPCADGKACLGNADCTSGNCVSKVCKAPGPVTWVQPFRGDPRIAADPTGNLIVAAWFLYGQTVGGVPLQTAGGWDMFVTKFTPAGAPLWVQRLGGVANDLPSDVVGDAQGNVILVGETFGGGSFAKPLTCSAHGLFVLKLSADKGSEIWSHCVSIASGSDAELHAVAVDASGDVYVGGRYHGTLDFGGTQLADTAWQGFLAKYSGVTGDMLWAKELVTTLISVGAPIKGLTGDGANVLAIGSFAGTVELGGKQLTSTNNNTDVYVARFSGNDGSALAAKRFGDTGIDTGSDVARDGTSAVVVTGTFAGQVDFGQGAVPSQGGTDGFLLRLDPTSFAPVWVKSFGSSADERGVSVAVGGNAEIALAAEIEGLTNFGGGPLTHVGNVDSVLARYSPAGAHLYSKAWGGLGNDPVKGVIWAGTAIGLAGVYASGPIDLGTGALPTTDDAFFAHLVP